MENIQIDKLTKELQETKKGIEKEVKELFQEVDEARRGGTITEETANKIRDKVIEVLLK